MVSLGTIGVYCTCKLHFPTFVAMSSWESQTRLEISADSQSKERIPESSKKHHVQAFSLTTVKAIEHPSHFLSISIVLATVSHQSWLTVCR